MSKDYRELLITGLVGERGDLYYNNAHFHYTVHALADMLPYWIDGVAAEAERQDRVSREQLDKITNSGTMGSS